ncbi:PEP-CTERM sorting domain-containing protein [Brasilonema sp. CT11]|nr:PEP-CTERM sorting domain-containing protein [Brasilonema sp. CT11]
MRVNSASVAEPSILIGIFATGSLFFVRRKKLAHD